MNRLIKNNSVGANDDIEKIIEEENFEFNPENYAAIYARKSSKNDTNAINAQISMAKDVIKDKNLILYGTYEDEESATKFHPLHRNGFKQLLFDMQNNKFKTVVVFRRDRLARKVNHLFEIKRLFKTNGVRIIYSNPEELQPSTNHMTNFVENIIMAVDELEPQISAERTAYGKIKKRQRGEYCSGRNVPFGYKSIKGKPTRYKSIAEDAKVLQDLFLDYSSKNKKEFNNKEWVAKMQDIYDKKNKKKKTFTSTDITHCILNPIYGGLLLRAFKITVKDAIKVIDNVASIDTSYFIKCTNVTPIIDKELWFKALLKWYECHKQKNISDVIDIDPHEIYLFKNLLKCNKCDNKIYLTEDHYRCTKGCTDVLESELLIQVVSKIIADLKNDVSILKSIEGRIEANRNDIKIKENNLEKIQNKISKEMKDIIVKCNIKGSNVGDLLMEKNEMLEGINKAKQLFIELQYIKENITTMINGINIGFLVLKLKEQSDVTQDSLKGFIKEVIYNGQKSQIIYLK
jgi:site-specific DNA recombinase